MKIRTDFVTNSSSSSFILSVRFDLADGKTIEWEGTSDVGEGNWEYVQLSARKSPKELGSCQTVDELVGMLKQSIGQGLKDYDEGFNEIFTDESEFIKSVKQLSSMNDISKITIEGYEDTFEDMDDGPYASGNIVTYDMNKKKQSAEHLGYGYIETEGTGGALDFKYSSKEKDAGEDYFKNKRKHFDEINPQDEDY